MFRESMDIVIIGSGNVAAVLGRKFRAAGHRILQIVARNAAAATELAYEWDTESANYLTLVNKNADIYLIAVSDVAIAEIAANLRLPGKIVVHTGGSVPKEILKTVSEHYGVFYPLQSIRRELDHLPDIPVFFEGSDEKTTAQLKKLAESISCKPPSIAGAKDRMKLHLAAVIVNNFTNHLLALVEKYCQKEGIDFRELYPLLEETVTRLKTSSPSQTLTGPAIRQDQATIQKHLDLLSGYPQLQKVYAMMTESIQS
jgi:predicted short-subunit dehydrogenase-like oxidoreductase (DUF2520 family)